MAIIALLGRPNVGKSSLFNRFVGKRQSLVWDRPGVTRDRVKGHWKISDTESVDVWDLAGWGHEDVLSDLPEDWIKQVDLFLFVVDGSENVTGNDRACLDQLRGWNKKFVVVANKADKKTFADQWEDFVKITGREVVQVSAETKSGFDELKDVVKENIKSMGKTLTQSSLNQKKADLRILILGRPNAGKSSLLNRIAGTSVAMVSDVPGTTRDVLETRKKIGGKTWEFVDTAGVRKKARIYKNNDPVEIFSATKALQELEKCDLCVFLIEPHKRGLMHTQDKRLLKLVKESLRPCIVVVNKWDTLRDEWKITAYRKSIQAELGDVQFLPVEIIAAKTGFGVKNLYSKIEKVSKQIVKIPTSALNNWLKASQDQKQPRVARRGIKSGKLRTATQYLKFNYIIQSSLRPMAFQIFCNAPHLVPKEGKRFLENDLRKTFSLEGIPCLLTFRRKNKEREGSRRANS